MQPLHVPQAGFTRHSCRPVLRQCSARAEASQPQKSIPGKLKQGLQSVRSSIERGNKAQAAQTAEKTVTGPTEGTTEPDTPAAQIAKNSDRKQAIMLQGALEADSCAERFTVWM